MALANAGDPKRSLRATQRPERRSQRRLRLVKESFDCTVRIYVDSIKKFAVAHVVVHGQVVTLHDPESLRSQELCIHPVLLDAIDAELRSRMTTPGRKPQASPQRASAIGYQD